MQYSKALLLAVALTVAMASPARAQGYNPDLYVTTQEASALVEVQRGLADQKPDRGGADGASACAQNTDCTEAELLRDLQDDLRSETGLDLTLPCASGDCGRTGNTAVVRQTGASNLAQIVQAGAGNVAVSSQYDAEGSQTFITQQGDGNTAGAWVGGDENLIEVLQQGDGNVFGAWLTGRRNELDVTQQGDGNVYLIDTNSSNQQYGPITQQGGENVLIQRGTPDTPIQIEQRGGAKIIIDHRN